MTDEEISKLAAQLAAALAAPISAMIQAQHAPLIAAVKRDNKGVTKKQFQAVFMTGQSLFGDNADQTKSNQLWN
jgi:hypothetical protein